ncbi:MAG: hypothetical protein JSU74_02825 [Candidatus Zixiibacteriota bacterium]|nr:MAG: hypothetical protein JSU74_02825 [candidate division Zixibacteria bacterium]
MGWIEGSDTVFNYAMWGIEYYDPFGLTPVDGWSPSRICDLISAEVIESGTFTTQAGTVAFEKIWVAPQDDCEFIIQYLRIWSYDGLPHEDLTLGEAIDWDVPWDYRIDDPYYLRGQVNISGIDPLRKLIYQQGYESYVDTGYPYNCQYNDERFAGMAFVESYLNGSFRSFWPYGGFVGEYDSLFNYEPDFGFDHATLYTEMQISGFAMTDSVEDLASVMCFEPNFDLGAADVYEVVTVLATIQQGTLANLQSVVDEAVAWYNNHGGMAMFADDDGDGEMDACPYSCCQLMGDVNGDEYVDALDIIYLVNYIWKGGPSPVCCPQADINGDCAVDPLDLQPIIQWIWMGGPEPFNSCSLPCWEGWSGPCE